MSNNYHSLPGKPTSLWLDTTPETDFPSLENNLAVDVAIIGGGLAGLTAATLLKAQGKTVAVIEAVRIVHGVTGYTTAKITSLHTLIYDHLIRHFGEEKARAYGEANQAAIEKIARIVHEKQIDCDFIRTEAYTYTESWSQVEQIRAEVNSALQLGLPASFTDNPPLPFPVKGAVRFDNQAQFHPRKYLLALAQDIPGNGSYIFENTRVVDLSEEESCRVTTELGAILAQDVVIASHFPFNDKTLYASRLHPFRSYVLGVRIEDPVPRGMFISPDPAYSLRSHPLENGEWLLLVGGEKHTAGQGGDTVARYQRLEQWARAHFAVKSVDYRWSTQDNRTVDHLPYIGRSTPLSQHIYVATGFGGWGMTNSTVAGMLLSDLILRKTNPWTEVYDPNRLNLESVPEFVKQTADIVSHFVSDRLPEEDANSIAPGEGKVVKTAEGNIALYKSEDGTITTLSPICTHMGCVVHWNPAEKSWDCPCHGSRFAADGKVIHGPAITHLEELLEVNTMLNTNSLVSKVALIFGVMYIIAGLAGFIPALVQAPDPTPTLNVNMGYGKLLGLFPVNVLHNLVHLVIGIWGIIAWRSSVSAAVQFARSVAIFYGLLAILGLIPATDTTFGLIPIYGHDIWLHAVSAAILAYFGFKAPEGAETTVGSHT
ncbi:FAD-dependent oxidoreductase [Candidatus Methylobacter favarea]|nr:FAD-dependent oxidoreductase [Candidatus Methylobacter favarea]